ncbi:hypothetical protein HDV05_003413 [Chytridiales sp. JEL 0842]|nr:hypothetical protein HDV05_003413 [Chytridiales sp. JEL 0842]
MPPKRKAAADAEAKMTKDDKKKVVEKKNADVEKPAAPSSPTKASAAPSSPIKASSAPSSPTKTKPTEPAEGSPTKKAKTSKSIEVGDKLPAHFPTLLNQDSKEVSLKTLVESTPVVLFFYPKANTPGCTNQACAYRDSIAEFQKMGYAVYGMSADSPKSLLNWKEKYSLPYDLLSDTNREALKILGVSKEPKGIVRSHIVIEKGGKMVYRKPTPAKESASDALEFIKGL